MASITWNPLRLMVRVMKDERRPDIKSYLMEKKALVDKSLYDYFPESAGIEADILKAMKYSLFAGGKRLRPILCMAGAAAVGGVESDVVPIACALEFIHTYSLIHDDLPAMDNDDLRRGKPSSHKVFGEAVAILAGDGLLTEAFSIMTASGITERIPPESLIRVINLIADAAGFRGMVGGQVIDIQTEGKPVDISVVEVMHARKTGALITASVLSGAIIGGGDKSRIEAIAEYGNKIGLLFQISDDILDIEGDSRIMGKKAGADKEKKKNTYPALLGLKKSGQIRTKLLDEAVESLQDFDEKAWPLRRIARYIIERKK